MNEERGNKRVIHVRLRHGLLCAWEKQASTDCNWLCRTTFSPDHACTSPFLPFNQPSSFVCHYAIRNFWSVCVCGCIIVAVKASRKERRRKYIGHTSTFLSKKMHIDLRLCIDVYAREFSWTPKKEIIHQARCQSYSKCIQITRFKLKQGLSTQSAWILGNSRQKENTPMQATPLWSFYPFGVNFNSFTPSHHSKGGPKHKAGLKVSQGRKKKERHFSDVRLPIFSAFIWARVNLCLADKLMEQWLIIWWMNADKMKRTLKSDWSLKDVWIGTPIHIPAILRIINLFLILIAHCGVPFMRTIFIPAHHNRQNANHWLIIFTTAISSLFLSDFTHIYCLWSCYFSFHLWYDAFWQHLFCNQPCVRLYGSRIGNHGGLEMIH